MSERTRRSRRLQGADPTPVKTPASRRRRRTDPSSPKAPKGSETESESSQPFLEMSALVEKLQSKPYVFLQPDSELSQSLLRTTKFLFDTARQANQQHLQHPDLKHLLPELTVEGFSADQIWESLRMDYSPKLDRLERLLEQESLLLEESEDESESDEDASTGVDEAAADVTDASEDEGDDSSEEGEGDEEEEEDYEAALRRQFAMGGEEDDEDDEDEGSEVSESESWRKSRKLTASAAIGDDVRSDVHPSLDRTNDLDGVDFFDGEQCEEFADFELDDEGDPDILDSLYGTGHRVKDDDEEEEENEEGRELLLQDESMGPKMKYNDFFLQPSEKLLKSKDSTSSRYQAQQLKMAEQIQSLEDDLIKPRPWQQMGEISGSQRPAESLLESFLAFERQDRITAPDVAETTSNLETVIRRRILDENFDDVQLRAPPKKPARRNADGSIRASTLDMSQAEGYRPGALLEAEDGQLMVNDQRPELGLAEVYERQHLDTEARETGATTQAESELSKQHQEIGSLFARLSYDLDSLSNLHFTPQPFVEDKHSLESIQSSHANAIEMEEILPTAVSSTQQVAPQEQYQNKEALSSEGPADKSEMSRAEKQRLRRSKKRRWQSRNKKVEAFEKTMAALDPTGRYAKKVELKNAEKRIKKSSQILDMSKQGGPRRPRMDAAVIQDALAADQVHRRDRKLQRESGGDKKPFAEGSSSQKKASSYKL